jgi:hypothetical protein
MSEQCPLYPQKQTLELSRVMSALCQKRTLGNVASIFALMMPPPVLRRHTENFN